MDTPNTLADNPRSSSPVGRRRLWAALIYGAGYYLLGLLSTLFKLPPNDAMAVFLPAGLGRAITKALVEQMGGQIAFSSRPGRTPFCARFPLA